VIGEIARDIPSNKDPMDYVAGYALGLDMTARNLQPAATATGPPWSRAKGYDTFCPISPFIPKEQISNPGDVELWLKVDGVLKQKGNTKDMIFPIPMLIQFVSSIMTLEPGDLILTGTPSGVGPVTAGQKVEAGLSAKPSANYSFSFLVKDKVLTSKL